jgi:peptide/nickel transport system permease protein
MGVPSPTPEWGLMISEGQTYISTAWWISFFPGLAMVVLGVGFALVGDGLAQWLRLGR